METGAAPSPDQRSISVRQVVVAPSDAPVPWSGQYPFGFLCPTGTAGGRGAWRSSCAIVRYPPHSHHQDGRRHDLPWHV